MGVIDLTRIYHIIQIEKIFNVFLNIYHDSNARQDMRVRPNICWPCVFGCVKFEERSLNPSKVIAQTTKWWGGGGGGVADENIIFPETCVSREYNYIMYIYNIIIWSRDTRLTILIIFREWISQDNLSVARDRNNLPVLILNLLRIRDVIIYLYNLMALHSYHNTCGNIWKITGQFTQVKCSASKVCQWIFSNSFYKLT